MRAPFRVIVGALALAGALTGSVLTEDAHGAGRLWEPCHEGALVSPCVWDARHLGNGHGRSYFYNRAHGVQFISHSRAHAMLRCSSYCGPLGDPAGVIR